MLFRSDLITDLVSFGTLIAFVCVNWALIIKRRDFPDLESPYRVPNMTFPYLGILFAVMQLFFLPMATVKNFGIVLASSYVFYFFFRLRGWSDEIEKKWHEEEGEMKSSSKDNVVAVKVEEK